MRSGLAHLETGDLRSPPSSGHECDQRAPDRAIERGGVLLRIGRNLVGDSQASRARFDLPARGARCHWVVFKGTICFIYLDKSEAAFGAETDPPKPWIRVPCQEEL